MTISEFLRMTLRNAVLILAFTAVGAIVAFGVLLTRPKVYQATALGYVVTAGQAGDVTGLNNQNEQARTQAEAYVPLFKTQAVAQKVVELTGTDASPAAIAGSLNAKVDPNLPVMTVTAAAPSPQDATERANAAIEAVAEEAIKMNNGGELTDNPPIRLEPYQSASLPGSPVSPNPTIYLLGGAGIGLAVGYAFSYYRFRLDTRIRTTRDLEEVSDHPTLAVLPLTSGIKRENGGPLDDPDDFAAREALRKLRTNLRYVNVDHPPRSIVFTSSFQGEGKSTIAGHLARVIAESGQRVVLIDADLRRPTVHKSFEVDGTIGLTQALAGTVDLGQVVTATKIDGLFVIPAGQLPPNPSELLGSQKMKELIERLTPDALVLIDAPPLLPVTDAVLLSVHTDGAIVVVNAGETTREHLTKALGNLEKVDSTPLGTVLNRASTKAIGRLVYGDAEYGYGYGRYRKGYYYYGDAKDRKKRKRASKTGSQSEPTAPVVRPEPAGVAAGTSQHTAARNGAPSGPGVPAGSATASGVPRVKSAEPGAPASSSPAAQERSGSPVTPQQNTTSATSSAGWSDPAPEQPTSRRAAREAAKRASGR